MFLYTFIASLMVLVVIAVVVVLRVMYLRRHVSLMLLEDGHSIHWANTFGSRPKISDVHLHEVPNRPENSSRIQPLSVWSSSFLAASSMAIPPGMLPFSFSNPFSQLLPTKSSQSRHIIPSQVHLSLLIAMPTPYPIGKYPSELGDESLEGILLEIGICQERVK
ncbi:hypothetical protein DL96DRAFT_1628268 [Flagelloscypha sp. PMI_526]|nr:hypothetical protein DL96DRAFT_1628268 [Flagelloscypha sp. PMI_526]